MVTPKHRRFVSAWLFMVCGVWLIGLGVYFMFLRPPLLPEDLRYMELGPGEIQSAVPGLGRWLQEVFRVMGGFIAGAGALTLLAAKSSCAIRGKWNWLAMAFAGALTVGLMSVTNFQLHSDFKWILLIPSILWVVALAFPSPDVKAECARVVDPKTRS